MVKLNDILMAREKEMVQHYLYSILESDIEDNEKIQLYQGEISRIFENAKSRYYSANPGIVPIRKEEQQENGPLKVRDLLTEEEEEEIEFLKWRIMKSFTPWGKKKYEKKIETILEEASQRNE